MDISRDLICFASTCWFRYLCWLSCSGPHATCWHLGVCWRHPTGAPFQRSKEPSPQNPPATFARPVAAHVQRLGAGAAGAGWFLDQSSWMITRSSPIGKLHLWSKMIIWMMITRSTPIGNLHLWSNLDVSELWVYPRRSVLLGRRSWVRSWTHQFGNGRWLVVCLFFFEGSLLTLILFTVGGGFPRTLWSLLM
jgi:hypothetical protein